MDGKNNDREFEQFLRENADNHRLYPSEEVWYKIHARLHPSKRWPLTALLLLAFTAGSITWLSTSDRSTASAPVKMIASNPVESVSTTAYNVTPATLNDYVTEQTQTPIDILTSTENSPISTSATEALATETLTPTTITESDNKVTNTTTTSVMTTNTTGAKTAAEISIAPKVDFDNEQLPLTIESVTNSYQRQKNSPRFNWQIHFTPSVSYRSLKEDQKFIAQARMSLSTAPAPATSTELKNVVNHRPDLGIQLGITGSYPLGKRLDFIVGLQYNMSKYDIKAFNYPSEVATIALVNSWGGPTAVTTLTSFRSNGFVNKESWLRNYYYSLSLPIGVEWRILGKKQTHWGLSSTIQPTYVVGNRSYVLSMDYQNYAEVPYLINKWNLNVGVETYAKFSIGKHDFRFGPQLRYQLLSSFKKGYPVSEHLYDFGVKLGMQLGK